MSQAEAVDNAWDDRDPIAAISDSERVSTGTTVPVSLVLEG